MLSEQRYDSILKDVSREKKKMCTNNFFIAMQKQGSLRSAAGKALLPILYYSFKKKNYQSTSTTIEFAISAGTSDCLHPLNANEFNMKT